jgi:ribosome maturation factor RimP
MGTLEDITPVIQRKLEAMGLELYKIKFSPSGPNSVLRVAIDKEGGVTVDDCERASHEISTVLDVEDFLQSRYRLEVTSPGADRPLTSEKDFRRSLGRTLQLDIRDPDGKVRTRYGTLLACDQGSITLQSEQGTGAIKLEDIMRARIELSFK